MEEIEEKNVTNHSNSSTKEKKPMIFISHHSNDAEIAEAFSHLLKSVSAGVIKSFRSSDNTGNQGIPFGTEWYPTIMEKLDDATDVVALLTKNSISRPWILFEAGVAKGKLKTPLLGIAIGIDLNNINNGPFAQFQNSDDDVDSLTKLVIQLLKRLPDSEPDIEVIKKHVGEFLNTIDKNNKQQIDENNIPNALVKDLSVTKLFEEIKIMFQDISQKNSREIKYLIEEFKQRTTEEKIQSELIKDSSYIKYFEEIKIMFQDVSQKIGRFTIQNNKSRKNTINPMTLREIMSIPDKPDEICLFFLIIISLIKYDFPWIYEIGKQTYHILKSNKDIQAKENAIDNLRQAIKITSQVYFFKEVVEFKESLMILEEIKEICDEVLDEMIHNI